MQSASDISQQSRAAGEPRRSGAHVVVVGGGITGLAAAWAIVTQSPSSQVTVLEASGRLGGHLQVGDLAGITVDLGPESMVASRPEAVLLARQVGLESDLVAPANTRMGVWARGAVRILPRGQYLGIPTDLRSLAASDILSLAALLRIPLDRVRAATPPIPDASVGEFIAGRLGREVVDSVVDPLLGTVYAGRADDLSLAATMPALHRAMKRQRSLLRATAEITAGGAANAGARRGAPFRGIVGGVGRLSEAVVSALVAKGVQVHTDSPVQALQRLADGWQLTVGPHDRPTQVIADAVILALPPAPASTLVKAVSPKAAAALGRIDYANVAVVYLALPAADLQPLPDLSAVLVPSTAGLSVKSVTFSDVKWDWTAVRARDSKARVIRVNLGLAGEQTVLARSDSQLLEMVRADLKHILGIDTPPMACLVARWDGALPQYRVGHRDLVRQIRDAIDLVPGLEIAGASFEGVGIAACIGSANEAVRRSLADLDRIRTLKGDFKPLH